MRKRNYQRRERRQCTQLYMASGHATPLPNNTNDPTKYSIWGIYDEYQDVWGLKHQLHKRIGAITAITANSLVILPPRVKLEFLVISSKIQDHASMVFKRGVIQCTLTKWWVMIRITHNALHIFIYWISSQLPLFSTMISKIKISCPI